jgi:hypothetical protein
MALETIVEFDKLRHLLRSRAETMELLALRLTWEERRSSAWTTLTSIMEDLAAFVERVRWSPAAYEELQASMPQSSSEKTIARRGSIASIASFASDNSLSTHSLSRAARFKLGEGLTKDAAKISSRLNALRTGDILAADKALRKLIDKREVPDPILDEQDLLELKGTTEVENVGKFLMSLAVQWKK